MIILFAIFLDLSLFNLIWISRRVSDLEGKVVDEFLSHQRNERISIRTASGCVD